MNKFYFILSLQKPPAVQRTPSPQKEINQRTSRIENPKSKENNYRPVT